MTKKPKVASLLIISQVELGSDSDFWPPLTRNLIAQYSAWVLSPHMYRYDQLIYNRYPVRDQCIRACKKLK